MNKFRRCMIACAVVFATLGPAVPQASAQVEVFQLLRSGGATLFLRHTAADWTGDGNEAGATDASVLDARRCAHQRHLSDDGRRQAEAVRAGLQGLELEVYAVGLCRTVETARVIGPPKILDSLTPTASGSPSLRVQGLAIEKIVKGGASQRGLRVIVGDYEVAHALFGATLAEGDALVLKPGPDGVEPIARIRIGEWMALRPVAADARETSRSGKF
ncbi:MAG: histidine phosphatase family protein [Beijerinckiaceae bacterium]|nr:histidine phosphatase family protein [Beijerinckiaceae bacterium]